ncbi:helix-turn-helix domain-containing protein [Virgibacillus pantothenticus]|uniref:helix-turn-helix domain-containing protein n=2 Tax=Virgibacillus pantothenticus TaxID=1473 RepID=UPI0009FB70FB|nr:helix-turn-helix domain-containing protein [Virgibacillus pantothenticus]
MTLYKVNLNIKDGGWRNLVDIGPFIKLQRTKRQMTQGELSEGIVSLSYLSKIENKKTKASPEIIQLLCKRLGIEFAEETNSHIEEKCQQWYEMLFDHCDKQEMKARYEELQSLMDQSINENFIMFEIHKIRYYIVLRELDKALAKMNELRELVDSFNVKHEYYWHKFRGNYYSYLDEHAKAMELFKLAQEKIPTASLDETEVADLKYALAVTHSQLWEQLECLDYTKEAMEVFQREYNFVRCGQCHLLFGISYQRFKMYDKAIKNFQLAKHLGILSDTESVIHLANQNLGYLFSAMGNSEAAINNLLLAIENKQIEADYLLTAYSCLIEEYYNIGEYKKAEQCLAEAESVLNRAGRYKSYQLYDYIIQVYTYLLSGELDKFKTVLTDNFIPYLRQSGEHSDLVFYAKLLANHLEQQGKYKESVQYYKIASLSYEEFVNM